MKDIIADFAHSFQAEWLKKKRSFGSWLVLVGSLFTPVIVIVARMIHHETLPAVYSSSSFWTSLWKSSWESMAVFFLPMGAILATSLIAQIEYRNNGWKQVHALPLSPPIIFFSKFAVILVLMVQFFVVFDLGIYLSAIVPCVLLGSVPYPRAPLPLFAFLGDASRYMVDCLPIVAAQYLMSLKFRNFLAPIGLGFLAWVGSLAALSWKYTYLVPYGYSMLTYLRGDPRKTMVAPPLDISWLALGYAAMFVAISYRLFVTQKQKG